MRNYVFVLWGYRFDETVATAFITKLREVGLLVKVVGLSPGQINGAHGLALVPDLKLSQALSLAEKVSCLIVPTASVNISQLKNDPRLAELFDKAGRNKATFVIGQIDDLADCGLFPKSPSDILVYPAREDLGEFVQGLVGMLAQ